MLKNNKSEALNIKIALSILFFVLLFLAVGIMNGCGSDSQGWNKQVNSITNPGDKAIDKLYTNVEKMPQFIGGDEKLADYIAENIHYPANAKKEGIQGKVIVSFVVRKTGEVCDVKIVRGIGGGCDEEAIRVLQESPAWIPGEEKGVKVDVEMSIPISFALAG